MPKPINKRKFKHLTFFRINKITYKEKLVNLMILLSDENQVSTASIADLPSNNNVLKALCTSKDKDPAPS